MSNPEVPSTVGHADLTYLDGHRQSFLSDRIQAKIHLDSQYPDYHMNDNLAAGIALIMKSERSRRNGHYYRYRNQFDVAPNQRLFNGEDSLVEASLLDLDHRVQHMTPKQVELARVMGGKGISAELGHIDQFGSWTSGAELDRQIRAMPVSETLSEAGFVFAETYGNKDEAKINYKIQLADEFESDHDDAPHGAVLKAVRKRAAADVVTERGDAYEIVKMSSFLIHSAQLGRGYLESIEEILELSSDKDTAYQALPLMDKAGKEIVEPFITHPEFREFSPGVLAVSSLYFALHRRK